MPDGYVWPLRSSTASFCDRSYQRGEEPSTGTMEWVRCASAACLKDTPLHPRTRVAIGVLLDHPRRTRGGHCRRVSATRRAPLPERLFTAPAPRSDAARHVRRIDPPMGIRSCLGRRRRDADSSVGCSMPIASLLSFNLPCASKPSAVRRSLPASCRSADCGRDLQ